MAQECVPEELETHPATDALVWMALSRIEPATTAEIADGTHRPRSTVEDALRRLRDADIVKKSPHPHDGRKPRYQRAISARDSP